MYRKVLEEIKTNAKGRSDFENAITERIYRWWAQWKPDYEGWLKCADSLYAESAIIDAIGAGPQAYKDYRASMKGQRDMFDMDMGPMKKGQTIVLKVSEFNTFADVKGYDEPMVVYLQLIATGLGG